MKNKKQAAEPLGASGFRQANGGYVSGETEPMC